VLLICAIALAAGIYTEVIPGMDPLFAVYPAVVAVVLVVVLVVGIIVTSRVTGGIKRWRTAAQRRGFSYRARLQSPGLPGLAFRAGEQVLATHVVDALDSATPFIAGSLVGKYAGDGSSPRMVASSFVAIPLARPVPNIVLLGTRFGMMRRAGISLGSRQKLSLEGDFDRFFTMYCPAGYERDALRIFTPDLMQLLIETTAGCDVELVDEWMFVYSNPARYRDDRPLAGIVAVTERMQGKITKQTAFYNDERAEPLASATGQSLRSAAPRTVSPEEHAARAGGVADAGHRIATRATVFQRLVGAASTLLVIGLLGWYFVTEILPTL